MVFACGFPFQHMVLRYLMIILEGVIIKSYLAILTTNVGSSAYFLRIVLHQCAHSLKAQH